MAEQIHVVPVYKGAPEHKESPFCWCEPELVYVNQITGKEVWTHREVH